MTHIFKESLKFGPWAVAQQVKVSLYKHKVQSLDPIPTKKPGECGSPFVIPVLGRLIKETQEKLASKTSQKGNFCIQQETSPQEVNWRVMEDTPNVNPPEQVHNHLHIQKPTHI